MADSAHEDVADLGSEPPSAEEMQTSQDTVCSTPKADVLPSSASHMVSTELPVRTVPAASDFPEAHGDTSATQSAPESGDGVLESNDLTKADAGNLDGSPSMSPQEQQLTRAEALRTVVDASADPNAAALCLQSQFAQRYRAENSDQANEPETPENNIEIQDEEPGNSLQGQGNGMTLSKQERRQIAERKNAEAEEKFQKAKADFEQKRRAKTLTIEGEVEYMRLRGIENARVAQFKADRALSKTPPPKNDDSLFVPNGPSELLDQSTASDGEVEIYQPPKKQSYKRSGPDAGNSEGEASTKKKAKVKPSQANNGLNTSTGTLGKTLEDALGLGKRQSKGKGKAKDNKALKKKATTQMTNLDSLIGTNVIEQTALTADLPKQPIFTATTRRDNALQQLIASLDPHDRKSVSIDRKFLNKALQAFTPQGSIRPTGKHGTWVVNGMRTGLMHYQVLGAAFMRKRESTNDNEGPLGGILADEMGLGKTLMTLANIINGLKPKKFRDPPTLIVASPALCTQWDAEIRTHCFSLFDNKKGLGRVLTYRGAAAKLINEEDLSRADIVLTSYWQVSQSYPKADPPVELITAVEKEAWWERHYENNCGLLHRFRWHRVVLDEAHQIKNHLSRTSKACCALEAIYHWAITGTPVQNSLTEFYPYFKFLHVGDVRSYGIYEEMFITPDDPSGTERLNEFLRTVMVRRTHADTFFNARLLDLPTPHETTVWLEFNDLERQIYGIVKSRFIKHINRMSKQSGLSNKYRFIYTLILRLRQMTAHILLVQDTIVELLEREDFEKLNDLIVSQVHGETEENTRLLLYLREILSQKHVTDIRTGTACNSLTEDDIAATDDRTIFGPGSAAGWQHGRSFRFDKYMETLIKSGQFEKIKERAECCSCQQPPADPQVTSCYHIYCRECLEDLQHLAARKGFDAAHCKECNNTYHWSRPCKDMVKVETENNDETRGSGAANQAKPEKVVDWIDMPGEICPSAKTRAVKAQVMNWLEDDPHQKIIIFTQFLDVVRILAKICKTEGWGFCRYTGAMSQQSRANSIDTFRENPEKQILLASLKAGGLGLNLTMASRCINLDLWWNSAVEQQAFCRIYRIGQEKETYMQRFVVQNSIDVRMMRINERKNREIATVMDESKRNGRLSLDDLMRLLGPIRDDGHGNRIIMPDDGDDE